MPEIKAIDSKTLGQLRVELTTFVEAVAKANGMSGTVGRARFTREYVHFDVELAVVNSAGLANTKEALAFKRYAGVWGLDPELLGEVVTLNGKSYMIEGANPRAAKYPLLGRGDDDRVYKLSVHNVKLALEREG